MLGLEDDGVHGHALHLHDTVVVKAGGLGEQVPLAKEGGVVTALSEAAWGRFAGNRQRAG